MIHALSGDRKGTVLSHGCVVVFNAANLRRVRAGMEMAGQFGVLLFGAHCHDFDRAIVTIPHRAMQQQLSCFLLNEVAKANTLYRPADDVSADNHLVLLSLNTGSS